MKLLDKILRSIRKLNRRRPADVVVMFRLWIDDDGAYETTWDAAHWIDFEEGEEPLENHLPPGVAEEIAKRMAYHAAQKAGGSAFAALGSELGKSAIDAAKGFFDKG